MRRPKTGRQAVDGYVFFQKENPLVKELFKKMGLVPVLEDGRIVKTKKK